MPSRDVTQEQVFRLSPRIRILPILHGSGDVAQEVRETVIGTRVDCLAIPLPPSLETCLEQAVDRLPEINLVVIPEPDSDQGPTASVVPVDPCQAVIMGVRVAITEKIARAYIDREVTTFEPAPFAAPDPFALKEVSLPAFAGALVPSLRPPAAGSQQERRIRWMAFQLHQLELEYDSILCLCHVADWPWLRMAYRERQPYTHPEPVSGYAEAFPVDPSTLYFALAELPYVTELYERRRAELRSDRDLSVDAIKELLLETRARWQRKRKPDRESICDWVTPQLLQVYLQYVRNHALLDGRLTPDLYTLVMAAKQTAGDDFAIELLETAKSYSYQDEIDQLLRPSISVGLDRVELPDGRLVRTTNRLQGPPLLWRTLSLQPKPARHRNTRWSLLWNPHRQCSWPPEDQKIESFNTHVREQAKALLGSDLARVEKFSTSYKDGIDLRESLRNWHQRRRDRSHARLDIYVKEIPPARGSVECVVFLFETPADPERYSWRATWYAEHQEESTLCFYATPFLDTMVGPGIGQSCYGGALFIFPPRPIPDVWADPGLAFCRTLEERLIGAAALHSHETHIALVSPTGPRPRWREIARRFNRRLVTIPLRRFSGQTVERLRRFHVLNGHEIRSYAAKFIH